MLNTHQFKYILHNDELNDIDTVKSYLQFSFRQRKPKKDYKLYINICKIYNIYPNTIKELLDEIPNLGYYKDYFYILMFSRNTDLDEYIYNIVATQLKQDLQNLKQNKEISTLGKWLPREQSKINSRCNFIDKFNAQFYPDITDKFHARKRYRKLKTMLNSKLGTIEVKMCAKKYDEINFNKVSPLALKRNMSSLIKHDECKDKLDDFETNSLKKMSLSDFIKELLNNTHTSDKINKMSKIWENNRFRNEIAYIDKLIPNATCIIDLSKDTFGNGAEHFAIGMALLVDYFSVLENKVIVSDEMIKLEGDISQKASKLLQYVGPCKAIDINKYYNMITDKCSAIIFVTAKQISNIEFLSDKNVTFLQFIPDYDGYNLVYYTGDKIRKFRKYEHTFNDKTEKVKNITTIISNSSELKDKSGIYFLMCLMFMLLFVKIGEVFFI